MAEEKTLSRSEREAQIKDRAGWVITVIALLLAVTTYMASGFSSKILSNTIKANDTWNFYQAKSIKQSIAEGQLEATTDPKRKEMLQAKIDRYESDPAKGEGKKELMAKAKRLEHERDHALAQDPWFDYAEALLQIAIVLTSVAILTGVHALFWAPCGLGILGVLSTINGFMLLV